MKMSNDTEYNTKIEKIGEQKLIEKLYKTERFKPEKRYYEVTIIADSNDLDYITTIEKYDQELFDEIVHELINIKNNYGGNHELKNYDNEWDLHIPHNGCDGYCHSLESLKIVMYDTDGSAHKVILT